MSTGNKSAPSRPTFNAGLGAALDALAIAVTAARGPNREAALMTGMTAAYSDAFDAVSRRAGADVASGLARNGIRVHSPAGKATVAASRRAMQQTTADFYGLLIGSMAISARLLERLEVATSTNPDEILRSIAEEVRDA